MGEGTILLVDDDGAVRRVYRRLLERDGFAVFTASNGIEATRVFEREAIDLIVSDIGMPGMSGVELLKALRLKDLDVPVILMTKNPELESATEAVALGALRYLTKPVHARELRRVALQAVRLHRLARVKREALVELGFLNHQLGDLAGLDAGFGRCLSSLWMAYQPTVLW